MNTPSDMNPAMSGMSSSNNGASTIHRVAEGAHRAVDRVAGTAEQAVERVRGGMADVKGRVHERMDGLHVRQEQWVTSARETVREHPIASIAVAIGVGWLVSRLLRD